MTVVEFLAFLDEQFGSKVQGSRINKCHTVGDLLSVADAGT
jgi:acyl carrier protein